jgi:hypothetical protein
VPVKEDSDQNSTDLMKCIAEVEALEEISGKTVSMPPRMELSHSSLSSSSAGSRGGSTRPSTVWLFCTDCGQRDRRSSYSAAKALRGC